MSLNRKFKLTPYFFSTIVRRIYGNYNFKFIIMICRRYLLSHVLPQLTNCCQYSMCIFHDNYSDNMYVAIFNMYVATFRNLHANMHTSRYIMVFYTIVHMYVYNEYTPCHVPGTSCTNIIITMFGCSVNKSL